MQNNFKGAVGLAEMYCDENEKRREKNVKKFNDELIKFATSFYKIKRRKKIEYNYFNGKSY